MSQQLKEQHFFLQHSNDLLDVCRNNHSLYSVASFQVSILRRPRSTYLDNEYRKKKGLLVPDQLYGRLTRYDSAKYSSVHYRKSVSRIPNHLVALTILQLFNISYPIKFQCPGSGKIVQMILELAQNKSTDASIRSTCEQRQLHPQYLNPDRQNSVMPNKFALASKWLCFESIPEKAFIQARFIQWWQNKLIGKLQD